MKGGALLRTAFSRVVPVAFWLVLLGILGLPAAWAQSTPSLEYQVKAAYLFNFTKLTTWDDDVLKEGQLVVGVVGEDQFGMALRVLENESVGPLDIVVRHFKGIDDVGPCNVLFVSASLGDQQKRLLDAIRGRGVLTVGETQDFISEGGIINFIQVQDKVHFEINQAAARQAGLTISSHLFRLAAAVY